MDAYLLLFEVAVRHAFYAPEPCAGVPRYRRRR